MPKRPSAGGVGCRSSRRGPGTAAGRRCAAGGERSRSVPRPGGTPCLPSTHPLAFLSSWEVQVLFLYIFYYLLPRNTACSVAGGCIRATEVYWHSFYVHLVNCIK